MSLRLLVFDTRITTDLQLDHHSLHTLETLSIEGGGGTSFVPFFRYLADSPDDPVDLCVYLTDGYGEFPGKPPEMPVLWVIVGGGIESRRIPFGEVARLASA